MRIGLITTLNTNIGDDFIREGLCRVIRQILPSGGVEFVPINKHEPLELYPRWHPFRLLRSPRWRRLGLRNVANAASYLFSGIGFTAFDSCDVIIQCGTPVYWPECAKTTAWRKRIWREVIGRLYRRIPVINMAAGSCYPHERMPEQFETGADADYARWIYRLCRVTSVRDSLAQRLLRNEGCAADLIPCSALLFTSPEEARPDPAGPVLINYMPGAGHYDWGQDISAEKWEADVRELIHRLGTRHRVALLCHDDDEVEHARRLAPQCEIVRPRSHGEFASAVASAKAALCNRMHAAVALAGMGIPSVAVGTDSRLLMVKQLGLPVHFVKDVGVDQLEAELEAAILQRERTACRLKQLQAQTWSAYAELLVRVLPIAERARQRKLLAPVGTPSAAMARI